MAQVTSDNKKKAQEKLKRLQKLQNERRNFDNHWNEVIQLVFPSLSNTLFQGDLPANRGEKRNTLVYESTAVQSNDLLASALHGMLTSPSSFFFSLTTGNAQLDAVDSVRLWIDDSVAAMHGVLNNSNFQTEIHEVYTGLGSIGTALMRIEEDKDFIARFLSRPIFEAWIAENYQKVVDTIYRVTRSPWRQVEQEFPEAVAAMPRDLYQKLEKKDDEIQMLHVVEPPDSDEKDTYAVKGFKFQSCYILKDEEYVLQEGGFNEFPYVVPRWNRILGEVYGRSPAMKVLPDIKMIQEMMKTTIRGAQLTVAPSLQVPDQGIILPVKFQPNGINYYRAGTTDRIEPIQTNARVDFGIQMMENIQARIREAFFINQLQLNTGPQMTATEVAQRTEENQRLMGPVLGRQHFELLRPLVERLFGICLRRGGVFRAPPAELHGKPLQVKYISQIARAQRSNELSALTRTLSVVAPIAQAQPEILDRLDGDQIISDVGNISGLPAKWFRNEKTVKTLRESRAQAHQEQAAQDQQGQLVDNVAKLQTAASAGAGQANAG
jgi:hypothetical protein